MTNDELFAARTNPDFLKFLEEARVNSIKTNNIALMYETLDSMLILDLDENKINELYQEILKEAFSSVEKILEENKKLNLENNNLLYTRALYEHAIEKWTNENLEGAKELFFVIANLVEDDRFQKDLNALLVFLAKGISFDEFFDKYIGSSVSQNEQYGYFISDFNFDLDEFLKENKKLLSDEYKKLEYLIKGRD